MLLCYVDYTCVMIDRTCGDYACTRANNRGYLYLCNTLRYISLSCILNKKVVLMRSFMFVIIHTIIHMQIRKVLMY